MPIKIPSELPAHQILSAEGVMVMGEEKAKNQDIRPLQIGLLNLMPNKVRTETQFARLLGATPLQIELTLVRMDGHTSKNTSTEHMEAFYQPWSEVKNRKFDGFIITGAPIERMPFEEVSYWQNLKTVLDWTQSHVNASLFICWGAQAALHHFYGVKKHDLANKAFGVYRHANRAPTSPFLRGFSDDFSIPVSRWTEVRKEDLPNSNDLEILMESDETGLCLVNDPSKRALYMFNHIEYDSSSLAEEYARDVETGNAINIPCNYFPDDDPSKQPENRWRSHAHLLLGNWLNTVYQTTQYDLDKIGTKG